MNQLINCLLMGGYYAYVWSAYALVVFLFLIGMYSNKKRKKRVQKQLQQWYSDQAS